jgi:hypothetical protein
MREGAEKSVEMGRWDASGILEVLDSEITWWIVNGSMHALR